MGKPRPRTALPQVSSRKKTHTTISPNHVPRRVAMAVATSTVKISASIEVDIRPDANIMAITQQRLRSLTKSGAFQPDIDFDGLRPLVDIAYWSTFGEVRRDAASAFATLSKNAGNLEILAQAGGLGAALAFLHGAKESMDLAILRDAADTLAQLTQLPSVQLKLLQAPQGIQTVFALVHISDCQLKRSAIEILLNVVQFPDAAVSVATMGGFRVVLHLLRGMTTKKDKRLKQKAAQLLKLLSEPDRNKETLVEESDLVQMFAGLFQDPYLDTDGVFRKELFEALLFLSMDCRVARIFVQMHVVPSLLSLVSDDLPAQSIFLVFSILEAFASDPKNRLELIQDDVLPTILAFHSATVDICVKSLAILNHFVALTTPQRQPLIDLGVVEIVSSEKLYAHTTDKRVKKLSVSLLTALTAVDSPQAVPRTEMAVDHLHHVQLVSRGILPMLFELMNDSDHACRVDVVTALWHLCESDCTRIMMCKKLVLEALFALSIQHDAALREKIAKVLADFATKPDNANKLMDARILLFLVKCIAPSCRHDVLRYEAVRALVGLSSAKIKEVRDRLVQNGVVGFLLRISNLQDPKMGVVAATAKLAEVAMSNLRHDVAALRIQGLMRNWLMKKDGAVRPDEPTSKLSPRKKRFQHVAIRAAKVLAPKHDASTEAIQNRFLSNW
ncbi:hypothetical protein Ae201684P_006236 [Aphanomyces euteiches]|nr:hypothetical protein Ae201684P_006236 [Aphanomyces euteiches]KAH9143054.1 hypothetical protein AeRB84_012921 [Aphanomyces euteiches]